MPLTFTPEQQDIIEFTRRQHENLVVNALAGAAKTTTIEAAVSKLSIPVLYVVFNKRNQEEAAKRMPGHVRCLTANALGHQVWSAQTGLRLTVNTRKSYEILRNLIEELGRAEKRLAYNSMAAILASLREAKVTGYIPPGKFEGVTGLTEADPFEYEPTWLERNLFDRALTISIQAAFNGTIDFDDQIYMPVLFGGTYPRFPLVVLDEAQDLSPINHALLARLVTNRLIVVGDPYQSIYAFRGAVQQGMASLQASYAMDTRTLSVTFRCPRAVVRNAWWRVPHFKWPDWAPEGEVNELAAWSHSDIPDNSAIICRNNAPLLSCALRLLSMGRGVKLVGSDIGPGLIRTLKTLGPAPETMTQTQVIHAIDRLEEQTLAKSRTPGTTTDKFNCLRVFADHGATLSEAIGRAEHIFKQGGTIQLLSGHKAKGLEWDVVYHLDPHRIPTIYARTPEEIEQEWNCRYVIETRAKHTLNLVTLETLT